MNQSHSVQQLLEAISQKQHINHTNFETQTGIAFADLEQQLLGGQLSDIQLHSISTALSPVASFSTGNTDFKITGGKTLSGSVSTNGSKNGAMGLLCASLLNKKTTILHNIPRIEEVNRIIETMTSIGVQVEWINDNSLRIIPPAQYDLTDLNGNSAGKTRSIIMFAGSLIHHLDQFSLPHSQGCLLGKRTVNAHLYGLEQLGVQTVVEHDHYAITATGLHPAEIIMYESGDTATENLLLAAALIPGKTTLKFASANYMVQDVCHFLQKAGVEIKGVGSTTLVIEGIQEIDQELEVWNSEDPIESMMFLTAGIITDSCITVERCPMDFLELELYKLKLMGLKFTTSPEYTSYNKFTRLADVTIYPSELVAPEDKLYGRPYPGINIDNLPFFVPIAAHASGKTLIHDWVWENRAIYFMELTKLGAQMILADPHRVYIEGKTTWKPAQVICPPALRPAMIILLGMLAAPGTSVLRNIYSIARGYEEVANKLNSLGAQIEIL
jgi:UDP-N-acetylglucosamine 1-carboxyvinyltransferase